MNDLQPPPQPAPSNSDDRWKFLRDVAVFELKLVLNNLHNFIQVPLTLAIAAVDVIFKGKAEGERFYKVVEYGRTIDDSIGIYSIIDHRERSLNSDYTVDAVVKRLEDVVVREYEKGGTAASIKAALDRTIDGMQAHTGKATTKVDDAVRRAADKIKEKMRDVDSRD